jgi:uncharacterized membrane protein YfcA
MPDELRPDDMQDLWCNQSREPVRMSADAVRRKARQFEAKTRRGFRISAILMLCSAAGYALFLYLFPAPLQRIGSSLTLAAYLYCAYQFRKRGPVREVLAGPPAATCAAFQAELKRLRDFPFIATLLVPFIPGPAVFMMGFLVPELGLGKALGMTTVLIASPFMMAIPLLQRKRHMLEREIDSLAALMRRP